MEPALEDATLQPVALNQAMSSILEEQLKKAKSFCSALPPHQAPYSRHQTRMVDKGDVSVSTKT